jgi:hypothetical protein
MFLPWRFGGDGVCLPWQFPLRGGVLEDHTARRASPRCKEINTYNYFVNLRKSWSQNA